MKKLKFTITIFSLLLCFGFAQAQNSAKAEKVILESQKKFDGLKDLSAEFTYTLKNPNLDDPIVKKGKVEFSKTKYHIIFPDEEMICNGKYIWIIMKDDEEITKTDFVPEESLSPEKLYKIYENDTKAKYDAEENGFHKVSLFANGDEGDIWKTEIWISKDTKLIGKAHMHARNGSSYEYKMTSIKTNSGLGASSFEVDEAKYKAEGFIITDLTD